MALVSGLADDHFATSLVEMRLMVCDAPLWWCGGRQKLIIAFIGEGIGYVMSVSVTSSSARPCASGSEAEATGWYILNTFLYQVWSIVHLEVYKMNGSVHSPPRQRHSNRVSPWSICKLAISTLWTNEHHEKAFIGRPDVGRPSPPLKCFLKLSFHQSIVLV